MAQDDMTKYAPKQKKDTSISGYISDKFMGGDKYKADADWARKGVDFVRSARSKGMVTKKEGDELIAYPNRGKRVAQDAAMQRAMNSAIDKSGAKGTIGKGVGN